VLKKRRKGKEMVASVIISIIMGFRRSFKTDTSFLRAISIGAVGTQQVFENLEQQGQQPIELERGSMSFKIWKAIKIKRIRVPDILCLATGWRVESRAKTNLEITMSHSFSTPERGWDYGLEDSDYVALVKCWQVSEEPTDWQADDLVQYVSVGDLREAYRDHLVLEVKPKGAQEGFESRLTWPAVVSSAAGIITRVTDDRLQYRRQLDNRTISLRLIRKKIPLSALVEEGDQIVANQVLAAVVPVVQVLPSGQTVDVDVYRRQLQSPLLSDRYTAAKALSHFAPEEVADDLAQTVLQTKDHIYVRLEAASSLARWGDERGLSFIHQCLSSEYLENQLEAVIVLGEVGTATAGKILIETLQNADYHAEIRAGAAWALGELRDETALNALIACFGEVDEEIRIEAARALAKLAMDFTPQIAGSLPDSDPSIRPGIAWALSQSRQFTLAQMLDALVDDDARRWVAYILGMGQEPRLVGEGIEALRLRDPEVYFAVTVLWQITSSWVYGLEMHG
jgi:HEAT repeat protein